MNFGERGRCFDGTRGAGLKWDSISSKGEALPIRGEAGTVSVSTLARQP
jgi:hypothetical protein